MENGDRVSEEDVMLKLKDDGYFDKLRLNIIRQLKDNEELRNNIIAMVNESAALTRPGAENLKPRQLSDAIHEEVGEKLMSQISEFLWGIIRSPDGMKKEITETVESVYNKLSNPSTSKKESSPSINGMVPVQIHEENMRQQTNSPNEVKDLSDDEPPGFTSLNNNQNYLLKQPKEELDWDMTYSMTLSEEQSKPPHKSNYVNGSMYVEDQDPPGLFATGSSKQPIDVVDDDPDVPPGFG